MPTTTALLLWVVCLFFILLLAALLWLLKCRHRGSGSDDNELRLYNSEWRPGRVLKCSPSEQPWMAALSNILDSPGQRTHDEMVHVASLIKQPAFVVPGVIYLGSLTIARDKELLQRLGITHVINCAPSTCQGVTSAAYYAGSAEYYEIDAHDHAGYPLLSKHSEEAFALIDAAIASSPSAKVLVHCFSGQNRSAALCIAYLAAKRAERLVSAVKRLYTQRPTILTNKWFRLQLVQLAIHLQQELPP